jgi:peptide/nickel transport system ATP-binding protein
LLERVGLPAEAYDRYPHELSGGQKQRAALARALVLNPDLLVADEPVNALDVSVQAEFLALLEDLKAEFDLSVLFISHDLNVVREVADRTAVMYLGEIVEKGPTDRLFTDPSHPYTQALVASIPEPDPDRARHSPSLTGDVPEPSDPPTGCRFHTRCPAIIQPEGVDLRQDEWRSIVAFRRALAAEGFDLDELRTRTGGTDGTDGIREAIRKEFDLPATLSDPDADGTVEEATAAVAEGAVEAGLDRLEAAFPSVCIEDRPDLENVDGDRRVACHLRE